MREKEKVDLILSDDAPFDVTEAYVRLRTNFIYATMNGVHKKVVFTSCESGEGKSTMVIKLAASLAKMGKRVILLDCDMRKSVLKHYLQHRNSVSGMSDVLSNLEDYRKCIVRHKFYGFDLIFSGHSVPNPSELLSSDNMGALLRVLESQYDYILIDSPPILSVSDSAIISTLCDGVIFVVQHEKIRRKQLTVAMQALENVGVKILGTVLNQYNVKRDYSAYGYGKKYYYQYYYGNQE